ncbi:MAG TPA: hypothetical protein VG318_11040 [Actinomycetota bacterium]|nr:hypothetical protein [Actinomycetota bacterium]
MLLIGCTAAAHAASRRPIVFSATPHGRSAASECADGGDLELFTVGPSSGRVRRLTRNANDDHYPSWSPGGRRIVFASRGQEETEKDLFIRTADGRRRRLTDGPADDMLPRWSPAGGWIVFVRVRHHRDGFSSGGDPRNLMLVRPDGSGLRRLTRRRPVYGVLSANWAPGGRRIVFTRDARRQESTDLFVVGRRGRGLRRITKVRYADYSLPDWSGNGRRIAFTSQRGQSYNVFAVAPSGGRSTRMTPRHLTNPHFSAWGPRSRRIAFIAGLTGCEAQLFVMRADGRRLKDALRGRGLAVSSLDW